MSATRETLHCATRDEAIAEAMRDALPGDLIEIHAETCKGHEKPYPPYNVIGCSCAPLVFRTGAKA